MTKDDWRRFCALIAAADEVTVGRARSEKALALMFRALQQYGYAEVEGAVAGHIAGCKFAVTPADVARLIGGTPEERSGLAWRVFLGVVERYGYYDSVRFPDPAYHYAVMQLGGWERVSRELMQLPERELQFRAKEWRMLYEIGLRTASWEARHGRVRVPQTLTGFYERDNRDRRFADFVPRAVEIGAGFCLGSGVRELPAPSADPAEKLAHGTAGETEAAAAPVACGAVACGAVAAAIAETTRAMRV